MTWRKDIYLNDKKKRLPPWLLPLLLLVLTAVMLFWLVPTLIQRSRRIALEERIPKNTDPSIVGEAVVIGSEAAVYRIPDLKSERISGAIFNERVLILEQDATSSYVKVRLVDGFEGYMNKSDLSGDLSSLNSKDRLKKILILSANKRVMSDASSGSQILSLPMGAIAYADYESRQVMRLILDNGRYGWINKQSVLILGVNEAIPQPTEESGKLFLSSAMNFYKALYLPGGMSSGGADPASMIFISARVNGLDVPRSLKAQANYGEEVPLSKNSAGLTDISRLRPGDILFFADPVHHDEIGDAGIVVENGKVLMHARNASVLSIYDIGEDAQELIRILSCRRYFKR